MQKVEKVGNFKNGSRPFFSRSTRKVESKNGGLVVKPSGEWKKPLLKKE